MIFYDFRITLLGKILTYNKKSFFYYRKIISTNYAFLKLNNIYSVKNPN